MVLLSGGRKTTFSATLLPLDTYTPTPLESMEMKLSPYLLEHSGSSPNSLHIAASLGALHMYAIPVVEGIWFTSISQIVIYRLQFTDHNERVIVHTVSSYCVVYDNNED